MEIQNTIHYEDGIIRWIGTSHDRYCSLLCGNAIDALRHIDDNSVHCIITSPPYYSLRDYGVIGQIGLEDHISEYVDSICAVTTELYDDKSVKRVSEQKIIQNPTHIRNKSGVLQAIIGFLGTVIF